MPTRHGRAAAPPATGPLRRSDDRRAPAPGGLNRFARYGERMMTMRPTRPALLLAIALGLSGCAGLNETQQRTATGALIGGAAGGVLGSFAGNAGLGALLGAGAGGLGGYLYDQNV